MKREGKGQRLNWNIFSLAKSLLLYNKYTALCFGLPVVNYFLRMKFWSTAGEGLQSEKYNSVAESSQLFKRINIKM